MENTELKRAALLMWIFRAAFLACFLVIFIFALGEQNWFEAAIADHTIFNLVLIFLGLAWFFEALFQGKGEALEAKVVSVSEYERMKKVVFKVTLIFGITLLGAYGTAVVVLLQKDLLTFWHLPGCVFFLLLFCFNSAIPRLWFLRRLGKVE